MPVFISHDFDDKPDFDNIADALEREGIEYWKPTSLKAGASLGQQLRTAIKEAEACVFVATRNSVESSWCGAELGAFWGASKPVVIWVAESTLDPEKLPKQFQHELFLRRISRVVDSVKKHLDNLAQRHPEGVAKGDLVTSMTRSELRVMMADAVERVQDAAFAESRLTEIARLYPEADKADEAANQELQRLMADLVGLPDSRMSEGAEAAWSTRQVFRTTTGEWKGRSLRWQAHENDRAPISWYKLNVMWRLDQEHRVEAVALVDSITDHDVLDIVEIEQPRVIVGRGELGKLNRPGGRPD